MSHPFIYLLSRSFSNRMKARFKRLKQPKYLLGALFVVLYLYVYFFQFLFAPQRPNEHWMGEAGTFVRAAAIVTLVLLVLSAWIFPHRRAALIFSEAEIAFLFPAPVKRRTLIHFKLLKSQVAILFTVLLLTLVTGRLFTRSDAWLRVVGWWFILSTLNLHFLGASFARTMLLDCGVSTWLRRAFVVLLFAGLIGVAIGLGSRANLPAPPPEAADLSAWRDYLTGLMEMPPLRWFLTPFSLVLGPYLASNTTEFWRAIGPALLLILLHYLWVIRSNVAFEEASLEASRRLAEKMTAAREGKSIESRSQKQTRAPFDLRPGGFAPVAFLWKNLISAKAMFRVRTVILVAIPIIVAGVVSSGANSSPRTILVTASLLTLMLFVWSLLIGAQFVRYDFRQDLNAMEVLKQYPLRGWQVLLGEMLAPLVILTVVQSVLLLMLAVLGFAAGGTLPLLELPLAWLAAAAILAPFWNGLVLLIPNAAVLMFPGWFQTRADAPQGIEVAGQRLLLVFGQMILVVFSLLPAALGFAAGFMPFQIFGVTTLAPIAGAAGGSIVLLGEIALGVWLVGKLFDSFDLAAESGD